MFVAGRVPRMDYINAVGELLVYRLLQGDGEGIVALIKDITSDGFPEFARLLTAEVGAETWWGHAEAKNQELLVQSVNAKLTSMIMQLGGSDG